MPRQVGEQAITVNLIAFLAHISGQIADVGTRTQGHRVSSTAPAPSLQAPLRDHTEWNVGITKTLAWMRSSKHCPVNAAILLDIQRSKTKKTA